MEAVAVGAVVSMNAISVVDIALLPPESIAVAVKLCEPLESSVVVNVQLLPLTVAVPMFAAPS